MIDQISRLITSRVDAAVMKTEMERDGDGASAV
jgi:hypothetical protein